MSWVEMTVTRARWAAARMETRGWILYLGDRIDGVGDALDPGRDEEGHRG